MRATKQGALLVMAFFGGFLYAQGMGASRNTYIILSTTGTVRNAETYVIATAEASGAWEALEPHLPEEARTWKRREMQSPRLAACVEDPRTFVSDRVDRYSAVRGSLRRNLKGDLRFRFEIGHLGQLVRMHSDPRDREEWGKDARTVLEGILAEERLDWSVSADTPYEATAVNPANFSEVYRVRVLYSLDRRGERALRR